MSFIFIFKLNYIHLKFARCAFGRCQAISRVSVILQNPLPCKLSISGPYGFVEFIFSYVCVGFLVDCLLELEIGINLMETEVQTEILAYS